MTPTQLLQTVPRKVDAILKTIDEPNQIKTDILHIDFSVQDRFIRVKDTDASDDIFHTLYFTGEPHDAQDISFVNPGYDDMSINLDGFVHFEKLVYDELNKLQTDFSDLPDLVPSMGFFRHIRPLAYDNVSHTMTRHPKGGVSFYLVPNAERLYDYWIYVCPLDVGFSARQAVHTLRQKAEEITPWGTIALGDDESIINKLVANMDSIPDSLSEIPKLVKSILAGNEIEIQAMKDAEASLLGSANIYKNDESKQDALQQLIEELRTRPVGEGAFTIFPPAKENK